MFPTNILFYLFVYICSIQYNFCSAFYPSWLYDFLSSTSSCTSSFHYSIKHPFSYFSLTVTPHTFSNITLFNMFQGTSMSSFLWFTTDWKKVIYLLIFWEGIRLLLFLLQSFYFYITNFHSFLFIPISFYFNSQV